MKNVTPTKDTGLVKQSVKDINFRLSKGDLMDLCLTEARGSLDTAFESARRDVLAAQQNLELLKRRIHSEVTVALKKRYAKIIRALVDDALGTEVKVEYTAEGNWISIERREKRPSYINQFRTRTEHLDHATLILGDHDAPQCFRGTLQAYQLHDDVAAVRQLPEAYRVLSNACDRFDETAHELERFKRNAPTAKQQIMKRVLEGSDKGREILELARKLSITVGPTTPGPTLTAGR